jgi:hypothetical protein
MMLGNQGTIEQALHWQCDESQLLCDWCEGIAPEQVYECRKILKVPTGVYMILADLQPTTWRM